MCGVPLIVRSLEHVERVRVDDERTCRILGDVEQVETARRRSTDHERGRLLVERPVARTVELALTLRVRHGAAKMRALDVRRRDSARAVDEEEAALPVEDRLVLCRLERRKDVRLVARRDLRSEALDLEDPEERQDRRGKLRQSEKRAREKADPEQLPPLDAREHPAARRSRCRRAVGSRHHSSGAKH